MDTSEPAEAHADGQADTSGPPNMEIKQETSSSDTAINTFASSSNSVPVNPSPFILPEPTALISNNKPGFKYKYPEAAPTPPGEDDAEWNKVFTAADSRYYNKHGKNHTTSRKYRQSGETRALALVMMKEKKEKAAKALAAGAAGSSGSPAPKPPKPAKKPQPVLNNEASSPRDVTPGGDKISLSISEKIKAEGRARKAPSVAPSAAPSSKQGTPVPSTSKIETPIPVPKIEKAPPIKKKGTAAPVKRAPKSKPEDKGQSNTLIRPPKPPPRTDGSDSDSNSNTEIYCICRGRDDHRMMVSCEGGCEEWFHCSCIQMDVEDARELLDKYVCDKCKREDNQTTWRRMCRYYNVGKYRGITPCRKKARVTSIPPSKYCSEEHRVAFLKFVLEELPRKDDAPSLGGSLNVHEVAAIVGHVKNNAELQALGKKPKLPIKEGQNSDVLIGLDYLTKEESTRLEEIQEKQKSLQSRITGCVNQQKLLMMIHERAQRAAKHPDVDEKTPCGYDNRLAMNEHEFNRWRFGVEGNKAFDSNVLGPRTEETKAIGSRIYAAHQTSPPVPQVPDELQNICLKSMKSCLKHKQWRAIHGQSYRHMEDNLKKETAKLEKEALEIIEDAETREATKEYHAHNTVEQLF